MNQIPSSLVESAKKKNLTLFIGAGLSFGAGLPNWKQLVTSVIKSLEYKLPKASGYLKALEEDIMEPIEVLEKVKHLKSFAIESLETEIRKYDNNEPTSAFSKLGKISKKIITTNYDKLLEKSYPDFPTIVHSNDYRIAKMNSYDSYIFKIHGDIDEPNKCIFFRDQYEVLYKQSQRVSTFELAKILSEKSFLFIGFSLTDPYFNEIVEFVTNLYSGYIPEHFVITTDISANWHERVTPIVIESYKCLDILLDEIGNYVDSSAPSFQPIRNVTDDHTTTLEESIKIFNQNVQEIGYDLKKEDLEKLLVLKTKVEELIFGDFDRKINNLTIGNKTLYSSALFDLIFSTEKLQPSIVNQIHSIRVDFENTSWHDRSIVVSALTLSLMNFKFDVVKANILLDFVSQFEDRVWQKALTGLLIAIIKQPNRSWMRDQGFVNRLKTLQDNDDIQIGIKKIDYILRNELYKANVLIPKIFDLSMFEKAINFFVPFYENNNTLMDSLYNASKEIDIDKCKRVIENAPFLDFVKYSLCLSIDEWFNFKDDETEDSTTQDSIHSVFAMSLDHHPYHSIISELHFYFQNFKNTAKQQAFDKSVQIAQTDLRTIILTKEAQLVLEGNNLFSKGEYLSAIPKFEALLHLKQNHEEALWQLAACYHNISNHKEALRYFLKIKKDDYPTPKDSIFVRLYMRIANCYNQLKDYKKSLEYLLEILKTDHTPNFILYWALADNYDELNDSVNCSKYCYKAIELAEDIDDKYKVASLFRGNGELPKCEEILDEIILSNNSHAQSLYAKGDIYLERMEWSKSIEYLQRSLKIEDQFNTQLAIARNYILSASDISKGIGILNKILLNIKKAPEYEGVVYGNLGHASLLQGDTSQAESNYKQCYLIIGVEDFSEKMNKDLPFFKHHKLDIIYNQIKNDIMLS